MSVSQQHEGGFPDVDAAASGKCYWALPGSGLHSQSDQRQHQERR